MKNTTNEFEKNFFKWNVAADKPFFCICTNIARLNYATILKTIEKIIFLKESSIDEEYLWSNSPVINALLKDNNEIQQLRIINLLSDWMPFATVGTSNAKEIGQRVSGLGNLLNHYRDFYSHSIRFNSLNTQYVSKTKDYYKKKDRTIDYEFKKLLKTLKNRTVDEILRRFKIERKQIGYDRKRRKKNWKYISYQEEQLKKEDTELLNKVIEDFTTERSAIDETDFLFFISLFLTKKEMVDILNHTQYKKQNEKIAFRVNRECYHIYNIKPPQPKFKSSRDKDSLSLQILTELARLPKHLKQYLKEEYKEKLFIKEETFEYKDNYTKEVKEDLRTVEMVRHNDSFAFLAFQYLELNNAIPNLHFQINLGKSYIKAPYKKTIANQEISRELKQTLISYGKLNDFDEKYFEEFINTDTEPHTPIMPLAFYKPKYHFSGNRIGIRLWSNKKITLSSDFNRIGKESAHLIISEKIIPSLIQYHLLEGNIHAVFKDFKECYKNFLKWMSDSDNWKEFSNLEEYVQYVTKTYNLLPHWIPKAYKKYFTDNDKEQRKRTHIERKLHKWLDETIYLLEANNKDIETRKEYEGFFHFSFKIGDLGKWIAQDINNLKPPKVIKTIIIDGKETPIVEKLNPAQFALLQAKLATLSKTQEKIKDIFKMLDLWSGEYAHPFLEKVYIDRPNYKDKYGKTKVGILGIKTYAKRYLEVRKNWLKEQLRLLPDINNENLDKVYYYINTLSVKVNTDAITKNAKNLLMMPILVPNELFYRAIESKENNNEAKSAIDRLITLSKDRKQWFYNPKALVNQEIKKDKQKQFFEIQKERLKDVLLWELLIANSKQNNDFVNVLKKVSLSDYKLPVGQNYTTDSILEQQFDLDIKLEMNNTFYTVKAKRKLRDYGAYRYFLKDTRLSGILSYFEDKASIPIENLQDELVYFENNKLSILRKAFELEEKLFHKDQKVYQELFEKEKEKEKGKGKEKHSVSFRSLIEYYFSDREKTEQLITFRNKIAHNQFISKKSSSITTHKGELITKQVLDYGQKIYSDFLASI